MKRLIGFDFGTRRVGIAVSDPLGITAQPLGTVLITNPEILPAEVHTWITGMDFEKAIIGLPLNMNGSEGEAATLARAFAGLVERELGIPVVLWDERLSSRSAERAMLEDNVSRKKRKNRKDMIAAVIILQSYLDYLSESCRNNAG